MHTTRLTHGFDYTLSFDKISGSTWGRKKALAEGIPNCARQKQSTQQLESIRSPGKHRYTDFRALAFYSMRLEG